MASPAPVPRLRRSTLTEDVYEALKALVMESVLAPGDRVNIDDRLSPAAAGSRRSCRSIGPSIQASAARN